MQIFWTRPGIDVHPRASLRVALDFLATSSYSSVRSCEPLSDEDLALLQVEVREVIEGGDPPTRKALLQSLVDEIRVVSRAEIYPSFSLPAVRPPQGSGSAARCPVGRASSTL